MRLIFFFTILDEKNAIFHNEKTYTFHPPTFLTGVDNERSRVDRPISWELNGKAMKYKYSTQGSVLSYLIHFLILFLLPHTLLTVFTFPPVRSSQYCFFGQVTFRNFFTLRR